MSESTDAAAETPYDESAVLAGDERRVTLGEREFVLREPVRSRSRALRPMFQGMAEKFAAAQRGEVSVDLDVMDEMVATICAFNEELESAREYIDDNARDSQVLEAYAACAEMVNDPFECTANRLARRAAAKREAKTSAAIGSPDATKAL